MALYSTDKKDQLINTWSKKIGLVESARGSKLNYEKRAALAQTMQNTAEAIKLTEQTNPANIG